MSTVMSGKIVSSSTGGGVQNAMIGIYLAEGDISYPLAESRAGRGGAFSISLDDALTKLLKDRQASVVFRAKLNGSPLVLDPLVEWRDGDTAQGLELIAMVERDERPSEATRTVFGRVTLAPLQRPVVGVIVQASDCDLRDRSILGTSKTNTHGDFEIVYDRTAFAKAEKGVADIAIEVLTEDGDVVLYQTPIEEIHFNAPADLRWDISLLALPKSKNSEFERVFRTLGPLLGGLDPSELQETAEFRDVTFLTAETELDQEQIESFALAGRLAKKTDQPMVIYYGLLRRGAVFQRGNRLFDTDHKVVLEADLDELLESLAALGAEKTQVFAAAAEEEKIVPEGTNDDLNGLLEALGKYGKKASVVRGAKASNKVLLSALSPLLNEERLPDLQHLLSGGAGDFSRFLEEVAKSDWLGEMDVVFERGSSDDDVDLRFVDRILEKVDLSALEYAIDLPKDERVRSCCELIEAAETAADTASPVRTMRAMEKRLPELFLASRLRHNEIRLNSAVRTSEILREHREVKLGEGRLDATFADLGLNGAEDHLALLDLKRMERVMKISPDMGCAGALVEMGITSAKDVISTGFNAFVEDVAPAAGLTRLEAEAAWSRSGNAHFAATIVAGDLTDIAMEGPAAAMGQMGSFVGNRLADSFPNLSTLFGSADACRCKHCNSVLSPAAYLVELLEFLDRRTMLDHTATPPAPINHAKAELLSRRPDIAWLDLNCANSERLLPYIDLVCELLEERVAPDRGVLYDGSGQAALSPPQNVPDHLRQELNAQGWALSETAIVQPADSNGELTLRDSHITARMVSEGVNRWRIVRLRQTQGTQAELGASPEYVNQEAYTLIANLNTAFELPFDLGHVEAMAFFDRFGLSRPDMMRDLQVASGPTEDGLVAADLGLSPAVRDVIITPAGTDADQAVVWGLPVASAVADMKNLAVFAEKTELSYHEIDRLFQLGFINPDGEIFIRHLDNSCDLDQKEIEHLNANGLDRIHRFLRLQRVLEWDDLTLDAALTDPAIADNTLDGAGLKKLSTVVRIAERTGLSPIEIVASFGRIRHVPIRGADELTPYAAIFLDRAVLGNLDQALAVDVIATGIGRLAALTETLSAILKLSADDVSRLVNDLTDGRATFENLSFLYGAAGLCERLRIEVNDLIALMSRIQVNPLTGPDEMLDFIEHVHGSQTAPAPVRDLPWLLEHGGPDVASRELDPERTKKTLSKLRREHQTAFDKTRSAFDSNLTADEHKTAIKEAVLMLGSTSEDDAYTVLRIYEGDLANPPPIDVKLALEAIFQATFDSQQLVNDAAAIAQAVDALEAARLAMAGSAAIAAAVDVLEAARLKMAGTLLGALSQAAFSELKRNAVITELVELTRQEVELLVAVVEHGRLREPATIAPLLIDLLVDDSLIDMDKTLDLATYPKQYGALRLLHKILPVFAASNLKPDEIAFVLSHADDFRWQPLDALPWDAGQAAASQDGWEEFGSLVWMFQTFAPVPNPIDPSKPITLQDTLSLLLSPATTRSDWLDVLARLTSYDRSVLDALDTKKEWSIPDMSAWFRPATWRVMARCLGHLSTLGASVGQATRLVADGLKTNHARLLRSLLKARYDDTTWLMTLKEITDVIRPQKRDALVAYLIATTTKWRSTNDIYDDLLIDTQMGPKVSISRIVQAHGAIQLFVERSRMGLEQRATADSADKSWEQWLWMRNYRVWEANRKIFLFPQNWLEPELRDNKTPLFIDFEDSLLQNEINEFTAEDAYISYLEGLDDISFLEVVTCFHDATSETMHVFARTKGGDPAQYYHRTFERERYWTPWKIVDLEITSDNLIAFTRRGRLNIAWAAISEDAKPDQEAGTPAVSGSASDPEPLQNPAARLRVQLAVSEYSNGVWKPEKLSNEAVLSPLNYSKFSIDLDVNRFHLFYNQSVDHVWVITSDYENFQRFRLEGVFDLAGCKGHPEVLSNERKVLRPFYPIIEAAPLDKQRYHEIPAISSNRFAKADLTSSGSNFVTRLNKTPGTFRITQPMQYSDVDLLMTLAQGVVFHGRYGSAASFQNYANMTFGTLMPYFFEDSDHAYVVVPEFSESTEFEKRSFSDLRSVVPRLVNLMQRKKASLSSAGNPEDVLSELAKDPDYVQLASEIETLERLKYVERFQNLYHPLVCSLRSKLYEEGIVSMMSRESQLQETSFDFGTNYEPQAIVAEPYPVEDIDFTSEGSYSVYNWELFVEVPLMIAKRLMDENRFEEGIWWINRIFDPTGSLDGSAPQKYWVSKPFFQATQTDYIAQRLDNLMRNLADPKSSERHELELAVKDWREKPFQPFAVARFRTLARQRGVVLSMVQALIDHADFQFRIDTMESITIATQLYILADKLLGPKPEDVPKLADLGDQTYTQLSANLDAFGNALVELENVLPDLSEIPHNDTSAPPAPVTLSNLYFCLPQNDKLREYWDIVEDRLSKVRASQNIDGIERTLALFAPPIDPGILARLAATGLSVGAVLAGTGAALPPYRFTVMLSRAADLTNEVRNLGNALLSALEKADNEQLMLLRNEHEVNLLKVQRQIKELEIKSADETIETLNRARDVVVEREAFYAAFETINQNEQLNLDKLEEAAGFQKDAAIARAVGAVLGIVPDLSVGGHGAGGSPAVHATFGGLNYAAVASAVAAVKSMKAGTASFDGTRAKTMAEYERRGEEAALQQRLAALEIGHFDQQITAANVRREIAVTDLSVHEARTQDSEEMSEAIRDKFTNRELHQWTVRQISRTYHRAYKLAYETAKRAERCYQNELGSDETFIEFGYWDNQKKGLQTAGALMHDIKRMEAAYLASNKREYEVTRHISLRRLDPLALVQLQNTGKCDFEVPETLYDQDHPGQYFRRIKTLAVSIPCVAGPYTSISARLTQVTNRYRASRAQATDATTPIEAYAEAASGDPRFVYNVGIAQSVVTSSGQNDPGLFELDFRDDRYLPFEGTGAIGSWRLELPDAVKNFDYRTISDVILHVRYTAREGGSGLRQMASETLVARKDQVSQALNKVGIHTMLDLERDYFEAWHALKSTGSSQISISIDHLPYYMSDLDPVLAELNVIAEVDGNPDIYNISLGESGPIACTKQTDWNANIGSAPDGTIVLGSAMDISIADGERDKLKRLSLVVKVGVP